MIIDAIVPAYNEEKRIYSVLEVLNNHREINKIIVINDASSDKTKEVVENFDSNKLIFVDLKENHGKSDAVKKGVLKSDSDFLFFCDADIKGLKKKHIDLLFKPILEGRDVMSVGLRDKSSKIINFLQMNVVPPITGERVISYEHFKENINNPVMKNYGMELVLDEYCNRNNIPIYKKILSGVNQTSKLKKRKVLGFFLLIHETIELIIVYLRLKISYFFKSIF
ncbi:MAG: glycosyltransferase [Candidatus Woesearchaeota archaeon]